MPPGVLGGGLKKTHQEGLPLWVRKRSGLPGSCDVEDTMGA